jgi:hypothetical protein
MRRDGRAEPHKVVRIAESLEQIGQRLRRVNQRCRLLLQDLDNCGWSKFEQIRKERVRMLRNDAERFERHVGEVVRVVGDDHTRMGPDGGSEDVPIVRIR